MRGPAQLVLLCALGVCGCDDNRPPPSDAGMFFDAGGGGVDGGGGDVDGGGGDPDGGGGGVDGGGSGVDAGPALADVGLTFTGCSPDFSGDVVVINNRDSIAVSATSGGALTGSIQLALEDAPGIVDLSTQHRVDTGSVINVVVTSTWTNIAMDSAGVLGGTVTDPIGGSLNIRGYDEAGGMIDVEFTGVTLQNPSDETVCRIDGRLQTFGLSF